MDNIPGIALTQAFDLEEAVHGLNQKSANGVWMNLCNSDHGTSKMLQKRWPCTSQVCQKNKIKLGVAAFLDLFEDLHRCFSIFQESVFTASGRVRRL